MVFSIWIEKEQKKRVLFNFANDFMILNIFLETDIFFFQKTSFDFTVLQRSSAAALLRYGTMKKKLIKKNRVLFFFWEKKILKQLFALFKNWCFIHRIKHLVFDSFICFIKRNAENTFLFEKIKYFFSVCPKMKIKNSFF
jgi:hypothetical protein